jgi:hypothetical protein
MAVRRGCTTAMRCSGLCFWLNLEVHLCGVGGRVGGWVGEGGGGGGGWNEIKPLPCNPAGLVWTPHGAHAFLIHTHLYPSTLLVSPPHASLFPTHLPLHTPHTPNRRTCPPPKTSPCHGSSHRGHILRSRGNPGSGSAAQQ